jgi:hypothetical protein
MNFMINLMVWLSRCGARIGLQRMDDDDRSAREYHEGARVLGLEAVPRVHQMPGDVGWKGAELLEKISLKHSGEALSGCSCRVSHTPSRVL